METNKHIIDTTMPDSAQKPDLTAQNDSQAAITDTPAATSADQAPLAQTSAGPPFTIDIEPGPNGQPISVNLTNFLTRHFATAEKYLLLQKALRKVFNAFYRSDEYFKPGSKLEVNLAYKALEISLQKALEAGARQVLGTLPDKDVEVPGDLEENPYQPEAYEGLMWNPANYSNVEQLQQWVANLQAMLINLNHTVSGLNKVVAGQEKIDATQQQTIQKMQQLIDQQETWLQQMEKKSGLVRVKTYQGVGIVPKAQSRSFVTMALSVTGIDRISEVDLVKRALLQYRDERLKQTMLCVGNDEADSGFAEFEDFKAIQELLDDLSDSLSDLSDTNHRATEFAQSPATYANWYNSIKADHDRERKAFAGAFSQDYPEEKAEEPTQPEVATATTPEAEA